MGMLISNVRSRWPGGVVPYEIALPPNSPEYQIALKAIAYWNAATIFSFKPRTDQTVFLRIVPQQDARWCSSDTGGKSVGVVEIVCGGQGPSYIDVFLHEIGHALGFLHEHQRLDRGEYVHVDPSQIDTTTQDGMDLAEALAISTGLDINPIGPYDHRSIMHYGPTPGLSAKVPFGGTTLSYDDVNVASLSYRPAFSAVVVEDGRIETFVTTVVGTVVAQAREGGIWEPTVPLHPQGAEDRVRLLGAPSAAAFSRNFVMCFGRSREGDVIFARRIDGQWSDWISIGGKVLDSPVAMAMESGEVEVVAWGMDLRLYHNVGDGRNWQGWQPLIGSGRVLPPAPVVSGRPVLVREKDGRKLHCLVRGRDGGLWHIDRDLNWTRWRSLGGQALGSPGVMCGVGNDLFCFVQGMDRGVWFRQRVAGVWSSDWESLGGEIVGPPVPVRIGSRLQCIVVGRNAQLYCSELESGTWSPWRVLGGGSAVAPTFVRVPTAVTTWMGRRISEPKAPYLCLEAGLSGTLQAYSWDGSVLAPIPTAHNFVLAS